MSPEQKALAVHRFERAETSLQEAKDELIRNNPRLAVSAHCEFEINTITHGFAA